jgi:uncharacterized protein (TIGR02996 family)
MTAQDQTALVETFLADILANPEDDTPRLVYADWLDEHGAEERADLIRVQCELGPRPLVHICSYSSPCHRCSLLQRQYQLLAKEYQLLAKDSLYPAKGLGLIPRQYRPEWVPSLQDALPWDMGGWTWRRGFVEEIACTCQAWLKHGPLWIGEYPLMEVRLLGREPVLCLPDCWCWARHSTSLEEAHFVPDCLAFAVTPMLHEVTYPTEDLAHEALSRACLKWAREERTAQK